MTRSARVRAFAKLNLGLRVLYKRPDGYHELRTVFQTISLADALEVSFTPARSTGIEMLGTPEIPDNLAERAARLVMDAGGKHGAVRLELRKSIPSGAGLGGGSSDAAAVLLALPVLAGIRLSMGQLHAMAGQLGSDVPFFLYGGTALGLGRGEELYPLPDRGPQQALLVTPAIHSSTADAYRDLSSTLTGGPVAGGGTLTNIALQNKLDSFQRGTWGEDKSSIINDFETVVLARYPELAAVRERLIRSGATSVAMTGSGSAMFGIFGNPGKLERAKMAFGERAFAVSFVSRAKYRSAWRRALRQDRKSEDELWPPQSRHAR